MEICFVRICINEQREGLNFNWYRVFFHQSSPRIELPQVLSSTVLEDLAADKKRVRHDVLALFPWFEIDGLASIDGNEDHAKAVCICKEGILALAAQYLWGGERASTRVNLLHHILGSL